MIEDGPSANRPPHILLPDWVLEPVLSISRSLKTAVLACTVVACAVLAGGCDRQSGEPAQPQASGKAAASSDGGAPANAPQGKLDRSHKGSRLADMVLTDGAGRSLRLPSLIGKPLLVNLWATWCAPCIVELPSLDKLAGARAATLKVLTVSQDMQQPQKVAPFLAERGIKHLEPWLDPKNDLAFQYEANTLPTTILYDAQGREVWRYVGAHDWSNAETAALLAEAAPTP
jgi:thiol-disulfide isomerase/thioredoxin